MNKTYNILLIDDMKDRFDSFAEALSGENIESLQKSFFIGSNIYEKNNSEKFCKTIKDLAEKNLKELYFYIFKIIEEKKINIVFMDLFLKDNDTNSKNTGIELIKLIRKNSLHQHIPIVLHSRGIKKAQKLYDPSIMGGNTYFKDTENVINNSRGLREKIFEVDFEQTKVEQNIEQYKNREFNYNLAILCALDIEYEPIKKLISDSIEEIKENDRLYEKGYITNKEKGVILKTIGRSMGGEYGKIKAYEESSKILETFKPNYLTMTGVAGGHKDNVNLGDVVIVRHTFDWEEVKYDDKKKLPRYNPYVTDKKIKNKVKEFFLRKEQNFLGETILSNYQDKETIYDLIEDAKIQENNANIKKPHSGKLKYHFAPVATGSAVINDQKKMDEIKSRQNKIGALDMEIYSLYAATYDEMYNVKALAIKGIVDYGDGNKQKKWQNFASYASAQTLYKLFTEYIDIG